MEAGADLGGEFAEFVIGGVVPEPKGILSGDAGVRVDLAAQIVDAQRCFS